MKSLLTRVIVISVMLGLIFIGVTKDPASASQKMAREQVFVAALQSGDLGTIDAMGGMMGADRTGIYHVYRGLVRFPIGNVMSQEFEPELATKWEVSSDKLTWTFHLRKGVKWHWGYGEVTSDDIVYSLNRAKNSKASGFSGNYKNVKEVKPIDKYTVQITTHRPDPFFLSKVANYHGGFVVCKKALEKAGAFDRRVSPTKEEVIGTGPFKFLEYKPKDRLVLVRNDDYWEGKPIIEKMVFRFIPDKGARAIGLLKGELAGGRGVDDYKWINKMKNEGIIINPMGPPDLKALYINLKIKPFNDRRVREALAYGINQHAIIEMQGEEISNLCTSPVPSDVYGHIDGGWAKYKHDPEKAKKLLAEAGYPNGLKVKMFMSKAHWYLGKMIVYQDQLKKCGINIEMTKVDHSVYKTKVFQDLNPIVIWGGLYRLGTTWLRNLYHTDSIIGSPTGISNFMHYSSPELDRLLELAESSFDDKVRLNALSKAQRIVVEDLPAVPVVETRIVLARNSWLDLGYDPKGNFLYHYEIGLKTKILEH